MQEKLFLFAAFIVCMLLMGNNYGKKKKILFFGDSITLAGLLPQGYIKLFLELIKQEGRENKFDVSGSGVNGNTIRDLLLRAQVDVLAKGPDIVVVFAGVNDVWHNSNGAWMNMAAFSNSYEQLVQKLKLAGIQVVVCTPAVIGEQPALENPLDAHLDMVSDWIRQYARNNDLPLVDIRAAFLQYINHTGTGITKQPLTTDGVHLSARGNQLVADNMWNILKDVK